MAPQYIFTMKDLRKVTPQGKEILKGIWLVVLPGAPRSASSGGNGAGKSTLLRIMAGVDKDFAGEAFAAAGTRIGFLPQEPQLDPTKTVLEHRRGGGGRRSARSSERYEDLSANWSDENADELGRLQDQIDAQNLWELDRHVETAMDALRAAAGDAGRDARSPAAKRRGSRCAACCCQPNDMLLLDEPTNHLDAESVAWLEQFLKEFKGMRRGRHPRPLLPRQRGGLDPGAGPRRRHPWEGNYSSWLDQKQNRLAQEEKEESARRRTLQRELEWVRMSPRARQAKGKARLQHYEELLAEEQAAGEARGRAPRSSIPPGPAPGRPRHRRQGAAQGVRGQPADGRRRTSSCPAAASWA